ncbi:WG repeat-containing protein, partial [Actinoplanes sp. NPDC051633]|uniref:WG repeat-containing protein n=1 Tax=Actinoplanes sp. NPDC051633 TaxID=3155670 RepID=UPI003446F07D
AYPWRFEPGTLREVADQPDHLRSVRDRLTDKLEYAERDSIRARLLSLRAVVSRVLGDLDFALADGRAALTHAVATGELRRTAIVQARLANVLRWRGDFAEADRLFEEARSKELPDRLRAEIAELAARSAVEQGRHLEAMNRFEEALDLRRGEDPELVARVELALDQVAAAATETGWGPYPRTTDEILGRTTPQPLENGQAFSEGYAWRPGPWAWELVDAEHRVVIPGDAGYVQVRPFTEGLAWVSRDPAGGWFAVDAGNRVIVPGGFEEVGPFRHGVAPVRRGGWGAIDQYARVVVAPKYRRFATMLTGGRRVDGFTAEGLAVVDAGDRLGVIDRTGQLVVAPVHAGLVIHPVAFLIADRRGRWGALDRAGEPLIEPAHASEADVAQAIEQLLAETHLVL